MRVHLQLGGAVQQRGELVAGELLSGEEVARHPRQSRGQILQSSTCPAVLADHARAHGGIARMQDLTPGLRVLTWNLFHGRARPPAGRPLLNEFARALAGWDWDVALLQEVPPWWPPLLGRAAGAVPPS